MRELVSKFYGYDKDGTELFYKEFASDDEEEEKPTEGLITGSKYWLVTSGVISAYSETIHDWIPQFSTKEE